MYSDADVAHRRIPVVPEHQKTHDGREVKRSTSPVNELPGHEPVANKRKWRHNEPETVNDVRGHPWRLRIVAEVHHVIEVVGHGACDVRKYEPQEQAFGAKMGPHGFTFAEMILLLRRRGRTRVLRQLRNRRNCRVLAVRRYFPHTRLDPCSWRPEAELKYEQFTILRDGDAGR